MAIIESLLDNDLYKFTMQQAAFHNFPTAHGEFEFVLRSKGVNLSPYIERLQDEISDICKIRFEGDELEYLNSFSFIKSDYVDFLENFKLKNNGFVVQKENENLALRYSGNWVQKILFEVMLMAVISEMHLEEQGSKEEAHKTGMKNLEKKVQQVKDFPIKLSLADFGTRRRYSREWHDKVVGYLKAHIPETLYGTSNLYLAKKYDLKPVGTMAHEWICAGQGLGKVQLIHSQQFMLETWVKEYRGDLGIALTDTIGMEAFLKDFDKYFAKLYDGCRHDSADPFLWGDKLIKHYQSLGIDPATKFAVFSDGLNFPKMFDIATYFNGRMKSSFGIGTDLTNDVGLKPLSMVIKLVGMNGTPVAKISDEPHKAICKDPSHLSYLKHVFKIQ